MKPGDTIVISACGFDVSFKLGGKTGTGSRILLSYGPQIWYRNIPLNLNNLPKFYYLPKSHEVISEDGIFHKVLTPNTSNNTSMTPGELFQVAGRNGIVEWQPSKERERLGIDSKGRLIACGETTGFHVISLCRKYNCKEIR